MVEVQLGLGLGAWVPCLSRTSGSEEDMLGGGIFWQSQIVTPDVAGLLSRGL